MLFESLPSGVSSSMYLDARYRRLELVDALLDPLDLELFVRLFEQFLLEDLELRHTLIHLRTTQGNVFGCAKDFGDPRPHPLRALSSSTLEALALGGNPEVKK